MKAEKRLLNVANLAITLKLRTSPDRNKQTCHAGIHENAILEKERESEGKYYFSPLLNEKKQGRIRSINVIICIQN